MSGGTAGNGEAPSGRTVSGTVVERCVIAVDLEVAFCPFRLGLLGGKERACSSIVVTSKPSVNPTLNSVISTVALTRASTFVLGPFRLFGLGCASASSVK